MKKIFIAFLLIISNAIIAQENKTIVENYILQHATTISATDFAEWRISDVSTDKKTGLKHVYFQQYHHQIPVYNAISICVIKNNEIVYFKNKFVKNIKAENTIAVIKPLSAINLMLQELGLTTTNQFIKVSFDETNKVYTYQNKQVSSRNIIVKQVYVNDKNILRLAWDVSIDCKKTSDWWNYRIDAVNGKILNKNNYTTSCDFSPNEMCAPPPPPPLTPIVKYRVFPLPEEAPGFGPRQLLTNPEDSLASPYTWQDDDGIAGANYTITKGNNVYAYEDTADLNIYSGYSPTALPILQFDFPLNLSTTPMSNIDAGLTNLFYMNNIMHDKLYPFGFDEDAGNFQFNNYGNGGVDDDQVMAEGFDGGGNNNANFSTPPDGYNPRMQMYLWSGNTNACSGLSINAPGYLTGAIPFNSGVFTSSITITDTVILANDGISPTSDACSAISNNIAGKIVLIDRGSCNFIDKATFAQNAGAVGIIIANNTGTNPNQLGGYGTGITIPVLSISQANSILIKNALSANVTVIATMNTCTAISLDANLDNGVIAHEYGHGVSNRLTGGASQSGCLSNDEQGGEGWSDWFALMSTIEPGDVATDARGIGTYLISQPTTGAGIRRYPYSYDTMINSQSYGDLVGNPEVHAIGEIWCSALWDMSWLLINNYGYNANTHDTIAGNNIAMRLVIEGMKLQPCNPGFLDSRDAILLADELLYNKAHHCLIWQAFARRGMGVNANQGSEFTAGDEVENFTMPNNFAPIISSIPASNAICLGNSIQLSGVGSGAFTWSNGNANGVAFSPTTSGTYTITNTGTCAGTASVAVTVNPKPIITTSVIPSNIVCVNETITINAINTNTSTQNIVWSNGVQNNVPFVITASTIYTVTITNTDGCFATSTISITANPVITNATISLSSNQSSTSAGQTVNYIATITPNTITNFKIEWYVNNSLINVTNSPTVFFSRISTDKKDSVRAKLIILDDCYSPDMVFSNTISIDNVTAITDIIANKQISIYPNPAQNNLYVVLNNKNNFITAYKIIDAIGKTIINKSAIYFTQNAENKIDISSLATGVYHLYLVDNNKETMEWKFVKN